jgi:hypothetical protein
MCRDATSLQIPRCAAVLERTILNTAAERDFPRPPVAALTSQRVRAAGMVGNVLRCVTSVEKCALKRASRLVQWA